MRKRICVGLVVAMAVLGVWRLAASGTPGESILRGAQRVEVFRVGSKPVKDGSEKSIGDFPILATGKEQGADFARRLSRVLLSSGVTANRKKCGLEPGVAYRLWNGDRAVEVLVCFKCDVLWPHVMGSQFAKPHHEWQDFDRARPELLALTKEAFPQDAEIQQLPDRRD
ncbi:MAG: hypothetical protein JWN70_2887 [Planctomycetaceae bacterium]|nr:hypothetical protein [Planctomycetaceae bacterium]